MPIKLDKKNVSSTQMDFLYRARTKKTPFAAAEALLTVCNDGDITSGRETVHPEWANIFTSNIPQLKSRLTNEEFSKLEKIFGAATPYDKDVLNITPSSTRILFLLGAGASKPEPSGIPTVTELLPDLLERARRLSRSDLDRLADFCVDSEIQNIEDLLTAAQLSEFLSRNPTTLRLIEFLIYGKRSEGLDPIRPHNVMRTREARRMPVNDLSAVAFLQDTLQRFCLVFYQAECCPQNLILHIKQLPNMFYRILHHQL